MKSREFYDIMENVGYRVDENEIYDNDTNSPIERELLYGYGIIIKAKNPQITRRNNGVAFLIGGFGTLGTEAAAYYFCNRIDQLGREFGKKYFSIVVRARMSGGAQTAQRIRTLDKVYDD